MTGGNFAKDRLLILIATGNAHKALEFRAVFGTVFPENAVDVVTQKQAAEIAGTVYASPDETGKTFAENAYIKSGALERFLFENAPLKEYASRYKAAAVIADDSGLCVDALHGAPGIYSARYASEEGSFEDADDIDNVNKLLKVMKDVPDVLRTARFRCHISALMRFGEGLSSRIRIESSGDLPGMIAHEMHGTNGFGYDPVLFIPELNKTTAMLEPEEKNRISHRGRALRNAAGEIYGYFTKL